MPRLSIQQTNFTAGEISPRLLGRVDIDRYSNAAALIANVYPVIHGGAVRRAGTLFVAGARYNDKVSRLIPYVVSQGEAYLLEFGDLYLRIYRADATYTGAQLVTPYTAAQVKELDFVQGEDTMFIAHPAFPIKRLRRFSAVAWDFTDAPFTTTPFDEQGHALPANLTLSAATVGTGRTATASASVFLPSDVGRQLISGAGLGVVTGYTSGTVVTVTITIAFSGTALASGAWSLDVSPQAIVKPSAKDPVASSITLSAALSRAASLTLSAKTGAITVTASAGVFSAGDVGKVIYADSGVLPITTFTSPTQVSGTATEDFIATSYAQGGYGVTDSAWRAEDAGKFVRINGGLVKITAVASASSATAIIIYSLSSTVASPPLAWSLEDSVWSVANGYPRSVTLHEQRLIAAGSTKYPQTVWGSRTAEYLDFTKGTNDDDGYSFTIASDEVNPIQFVFSMRNLIVNTYGGEFSLQGGVEKPITPTNVRIRPESAHGCASVRPVLIGKESMFIQRAGRKVRAIGYDYARDGYVAPDLAVLAEHITIGGITAMAYQQEPDLLLWCVRGDGAMLSCTIDRDQSVIGWARHYTDGAFESVATIPAGDREQTWVIVRRIVDGVSVRYIERFDETFAPQLPAAIDPNAFPPVVSPQVYGCTVDSGMLVDNAAGQTVFTGLAHLEGKMVDILADGSVMPAMTVAGGQITLPRKSFRTLIGLHFASQISLLTPEVGTGTGTAQGNSMRTAELTLRFLNTLGAKIQSPEGRVQIIPFRKFGAEVLDQAPEAQTRNVRVETLGWDRGSSTVTIIQDQPLPMHLLAAIRKFTVND